MSKLGNALVICGLMIGSAACGGVAYEPGPSPSTLTLKNRSSFILKEVHLTPVNSRSWGPDLLSRDLLPGDNLVVDGIACDSYDVLVVDETDVSCVLPQLDLCFTDQTWLIDDQVLDRCAFEA